MENTIHFIIEVILIVMMLTYKDKYNLWKAKAIGYKEYGERFLEELIKALNNK